MSYRYSSEFSRTEARAGGLWSFKHVVDINRKRADLYCLVEIITTFYIHTAIAAAKYTQYGTTLVLCLI